MSQQTFMKDNQNLNTFGTKWNYLLCLLVFYCVTVSEALSLVSRSRSTSLFLRHNPLVLSKQGRWIQLRAMDPTLPGNENFPPSSSSNVTPPPGTSKPAEDAYLPIINVHYDYKPTDWILREKDANYTTQLRHEAAAAADKLLRDEGKITASLMKQQASFYKLRDAVLQNAAINKQRVEKSRFLILPLPSAIATDTIVNTPIMDNIRKKAFDEWLKSASSDMKAKYKDKGDQLYMDENDFYLSGNDIVHKPLDIHGHYANQFVSS